jgi:hypothetical protein
MKNEIKDDLVFISHCLEDVEKAFVNDEEITAFSLLMEIKDGMKILIEKVEKTSRN